MKYSLFSLALLLVCTAAFFGCTVSKDINLEAGAIQVNVPADYFATERAGESTPTIDADAEGTQSTTGGINLYESDGNTAQRGVINIAPYWASDTNPTSYLRGGGIQTSVAPQGSAAVTSDASGDGDTRLEAPGDDINDDTELVPEPEPEVLDVPETEPQAEPAE